MEREVRSAGQKEWKDYSEGDGTGYWHPDSEREKAPAATYPNWVIIEVNGQKDVYQQSELNDLLKIVKK